MIGRAYELYFNKNCRSPFVTGLTSILALACSVGAELVIHSKHSYGCVCNSIPAQPSEILVQHPGVSVTGIVTTQVEPGLIWI